MLREERRLENHLERVPQPVLLPTPPGTSGQQRKRMLIALGVLLGALTAIVLKDSDFWFPPKPEAQDAAYTPSATKTTSSPAKAPAPAVHERKSVTADKAVTAQAPAPPLTAKAERTALPELQVEVVAGNHHTTLPAKNNAIHLDVVGGTTSPAAKTPPSQVVVAAQQVKLSPQATQSVTQSVAPNYPLLARQMRVQGAVTLQALISREGTIQELQILNGPAILADAAREAVRQWRFKPYLLNGEPVETQAKITVNFTISTN